MIKIAQELLEMKEQIENADRRRSELQGQLKELLSRLKKDFDCSSAKQGDKKLDKMKADLDKKQKDLDSGVDKLKEKMEKADEEG
jgi:predicted transcriptional regulator